MASSAFRQFVSTDNLHLAFRRLTTATNVQYKTFYRRLYPIYEMALEANLRDLRTRLIGGAYDPSAVCRIFLPKPSGLQRTLTLLTLEDQIVYQALANVFAHKVADPRKKIESKFIYSNLLNRGSNQEFFLVPWRLGFARMRRRIEKLHQQGYRWVANFDLAAYYDTISHELLMRVLSPRGGAEDLAEAAAKWLKKWTSAQSSGVVEHGIPQGPIASDLIAESFLLSIDLKLAGEFKFVRYVDDIRLFAKSDREVRQAAIELEILCKNKGLIPQAKKCGIFEATSVDQVLQSIPSMVAERNAPGGKKKIPARRALKGFKGCLEGRPLKISDKAGARYYLYRAEPSQQLMGLVLKVFPRHPEHIDAFLFYLQRHERSKRALKQCIDYLEGTPYDYVAGRLWEFVAQHASTRQLRDLRPFAVNTAKDKKCGAMSRIGACQFLCVCEHASGQKLSKFLMWLDPALAQAQVVSWLPDSSYAHSELIARLLTRSSCESSLMLAPKLSSRGENHLTYGVKAKQLPSQTRNVFRALDLLTSPYEPVEALGEALARQFRLKSWTGWQRVFAKEYRHAQSIRLQAQTSFELSPSHWLECMNSFNDALVRALIQILKKRGMPGVCAIVGADGKLVDFGSLVSEKSPFAVRYPGIANGLRDANKRRCRLPSTHPFDKKTGARSSELTRQERNRMVNVLSKSYADMIVQFSFV